MFFASSSIILHKSLLLLYYVVTAMATKFKQISLRCNSNERHIMVILVYISCGKRHKQDLQPFLLHGIQVRSMSAPPIHYCRAFSSSKPKSVGDRMIFCCSRCLRNSASNHPPNPRSLTLHFPAVTAANFHTPKSFFLCSKFFALKSPITRGDF